MDFLHFHIITNPFDYNWKYVDDTSPSVSIDYPCGTLRLIMAECFRYELSEKMEMKPD